MIKLCTNVKAAQKSVKEILCCGCTHVGASFKHIYSNQPGNIVLIAISTPGEKTYVFDLKNCPEIMHEGELYRVLMAEELTKVVHDCRQAAFTLRKQFGVRLKNVFDTQAAYCVMMMDQDLPPRLIELYNLYGKFGDLSQCLMPMLQESVTQGGLFWARRPITEEMGQFLACETISLTPILHKNISAHMTPEHQSWTEDLCYGYIHGKFNSEASKCNETPRSRKMALLNDDQKHLLTGTIPLAGGTPI